jgi:F0F1-type ATP synthase membrane subunit b/b'
MIDVPPKRALDDYEIRLKLAEASKGVADAESELKEALETLAASDRTDNVVIDQTTKRALAKLRAVRAKLDEVEAGINPATGKA